MKDSRTLVGVFDSGVGGMSVLAAIRERMPNLDVVYFGDNARAPYGNRTEDEVKQYTKEILRFLQGKGCTHFVSACNSISALVTKEILGELGIDLSRYVDMVLPTKKYIANAHIGRLVVLATVLTTRTKIYEYNLSPYVIEYIGVGNEDLARQIEFNEGDHAIRKTITNIFLSQEIQSPATLLLSCTHYPLVKHIFEEEKGNLPIDIIDPSMYVAQELELLVDDTGENGSTEIFMTKSSETMRKLARELDVQGYSVVSL